MTAAIPRPEAYIPVPIPILSPSINGGTDGPGPKPFGLLASPLGGAAKRGVRPINDQPPRLGYSSITHTAHNPPSEPLPDPVLSELIQNAIGKGTAQRTRHAERATPLLYPATYPVDTIFSIGGGVA